MCVLKLVLTIFRKWLHNIWTLEIEGRKYNFIVLDIALFLDLLSGTTVTVF
jgi:hypothetical protein